MLSNKKLYNFVLIMHFASFQTAQFKPFLVPGASFFPRRMAPPPAPCEQKPIVHQQPQPATTTTTTTTTAPPFNKIKKIIGNYSYDPSDKIGSGYSSNVYRGVNEKTGEAVAIKVIDLNQITTPISQALLKNEIWVLRQLDSPNLLKVYDIILTSNNTYIVTEFCEQGDLADLIKRYGRLSEEVALEVLEQILQGMKALQIRSKVPH